MAPSSPVQSSDGGDSVWDESSVKVDHSKSNQRILYIQVRPITLLIVVFFNRFAHEQKDGVLFDNAT